MSWPSLESVSGLSPLFVVGKESLVCTTTKYRRGMICAVINFNDYYRIAYLASAIISYADAAYGVL